ncbi:MAG: glycosyltransferase family 4 protein [Moorea sp. SIOASIH]|uniref:glycosyltransferase n=1 Tax=Moorena sp. SIOASIH TaxID=2607817 RepID=UPI0013B75373|nr:glycosyltransferase [Moorena sp. SIOASIH]NEO35106.1 glycosyltransferase family 4 protein [Moorena sp. SIOASIH]
MKVLLSAYQCQPNTGSENGIGWAWATQLARMGHEVWVITWSYNQIPVEQELQVNPIPNIHFIFCDHPTWLSRLFKILITRQVMLLSFPLWELMSIWWQWDAYRIAKSLTQEVVFDRVHHVTNTAIRRPSFMGLLGIPFIFGPVAGGVKAPWFLRKSYPLKGWLFDFIRDISNTIVQFDPLMNLTFITASKIYCRSKDIQALIPKFYRYKSEVIFDIPLHEIREMPLVSEQKLLEKDTFQVLFVGRFLYWKGVHLALKAFSLLHQKIPNSRFTVIGRGSEETWLQRLSEKLGIKDAVDWIPWMEQKKLSSAYLQHDVFLFPSLHDSGGLVILEALCHGLPVVCLDLGGPGVMVDETCGRVIKTDGFTEEAVIQRLSDALVELAENSELRQQLSERALAQPTKFEFKNVVEQIYSSSVFVEKTLKEAPLDDKS